MVMPLGMDIGAGVEAADAGEIDTKASATQTDANAAHGKTRTGINKLLHAINCQRGRSSLPA
jgi:hypothetical protein